MTGTKQTPDAQSGAEAQAPVSAEVEGSGGAAPAREAQAGTPPPDTPKSDAPETNTGQTDRGQPDTAIADRVADSWVDTKAPDDMKPYLRLSRIDRPIGTWLLLLPCWWGALLGALATPGSSALTTIWIMLVCGAGAVLMRGAGCTWNDISDRDIDPLVERTRNRPLAAGQVTVREALIWMGFQMFASFLLLLTLNGAAIALGFLALVPVAIYPFAKRFTWWPQVFLGLAFNWGALLAWTAQTGSLGMPAVILYVAGISWTLFYDTIYAHQDREDDALIGVKSTARLFGDNTENWLRGFLIVAVVLMSLAIIYALAPLADPLKLSLSLAGAWAFGAHLNWQLGLLKIDDSAVCLRLFRSNRDAGLIVVLIFAAALLV